VLEKMLERTEALRLEIPQEKTSSPSAGVCLHIRGVWGIPECKREELQPLH